MAAPLRLLAFSGRLSSITNTTKVVSICAVYQQPQITQQNRSINFFTKVTGDDLWRGVTSVSNAGSKRGRGKGTGKKRAIDLNRGQILGEGVAKIEWSGLTKPMYLSRTEKTKWHVQGEKSDMKRGEELASRRAMFRAKKRRALPPLVRGWTGSRIPGQRIPNPEPIGDYSFDDFECRVLSMRLVSNMTGTLGKLRKFSAFVVMGNKNGLAGFGSGSAQQGHAAMKRATRRASQNLMYIPRFEEHTVHHNMHSRFHRSQLYIHKQEKGFGLKCHRALIATCELIGIKDLHVKVENSTTNVGAIVQGFFNALTNQETPEELAERTGLHVVELRKERDYLPVLKASPPPAPSADTVTPAPSNQAPLSNEMEDIELCYSRLYNGGRMEYQRPPKKPYFWRNPGYKQKLVIDHKMRGQKHAQIVRMANLW